MTAPTVDRPDVEVVDFSDPRPRRRRRWRALVIALIVVLGAAVVWSVWFSTLLSARQVRVVGVDAARADAVIAAAAIGRDVPLARIDTGRAETAIEALPWVQQAEVRRGWPSEVVLAVTPRVPLAVLGSGKAVDADGVEFAVDGPMPKGLPRVVATGDARTAAMAVLAELPADLSRKVVSLTATTMDDVTLTLRSGDQVRWGSPEQAAFKAEVLAALMKRKASVYDVSAPELPTTFKSAG